MLYPFVSCAGDLLSFLDLWISGFYGICYFSAIVSSDIVLFLLPVPGSGSCPSFPKKYIVGGLSFLVFIKVVILHSHCLSKEVCGVI